MKETFNEEVEILDFDQPMDSDADYKDFNSYQRLGEQFWRNENGVDGTLFRLPLRLEPSRISSVVYDEDRINGLIERFKEEAHSTMIFLKHVQSIKICIIENGSTAMEEVYSATLTEQSQEYQALKTAFVNDVNTLVDEEGDFETIKMLSHFLQIKVRTKENQDEDDDDEESGKIYEYAVCERYGYEGTNENFLSLMHDEELSYVPLVAIAYPISQELDEGGHVFCTLPLPLHSRKMTGMPVHVNGFFALGQDRKDLKWKSLATQGNSNDKTVNWNVYLLEELIPIVYSNLFDFLKTLSLETKVLYKAWPDQNEIDSKWKPILDSFQKFMQEKPFVYVGYQNTWYKTRDVWFIKAEEMTEQEFSAVGNLLVSTNTPFAIAPSAITKCLPCKWIDPYKVNDLIIRWSIFIRLPMETQCNILSYSIKDENGLKLLINQKVFPLSNGSVFQLQRRGYNHSGLHYITIVGNSTLLPSNNRTVNEKFFEGNAEFFNRIKAILNQNEHFNVTVLDQPSKVISAIKDLTPQRWRNAGEKLPSSEVSQKWVNDVIEYRKANNISYATLRDLPLIRMHNLNTKYLWKVGVNPKPLVASYLNDKISQDLKSLLENAGVFFVADNDPELRCLVSEGMINVSNVSIVVSTMNSKHNLVCNKYPAGNEILNTEIMNMINYYQWEIPELFKDLPIFQTTGKRAVSSRNGYFVSANDIPKEWNDRYGNIITRNIIPDRLIKRLNANTWTFEQVCQKLFSQNLSQNDLISLSTAVLQRLQYSSALQPLATRYVRIKSDNGTICRPSELFVKNRTTESIFIGEKGKFPSREYQSFNRILTNIGLKSVDHFSYAEINASLQHVQTNALEKQNIIMKVNSILVIIKKNGLQNRNFNQYSWIPASSEPPRGYPQSMPWRGTNTNAKLTLLAPSQIYLDADQSIVGSVHYIVHPEICANFRSTFAGNTQHISKIIFQDVLANLKNLERTFNCDEKVTFQNMVIKIYQYIASYFTTPLLQWIRGNNEFNIWHGAGFISIQKIFLAERNDQVKNVSPYFFQPPKEVVSILGGTVLNHLNCHKSAYDVYVDTLKAISTKYAKMKTQKQHEDMIKDTDLAVSLVREIATRFSTDAQQNKADIFVPLDSATLKLAPLETCYYLDFNGETNFSLSSNILNRYIETAKARQLGVPNLASKVLQGNQASIFEPWGQKQAPLADNLKRILEEYQDGLAIIKELVQNADDAGANKVSILYDKRKNEQLKSHLISPSMKEWQGPALWVHNDKMFTEEDFKNITRLNAGTKKSEATKIGKFGLGFNAVYHLTDVPSILSNKSLIFFDPHFKYLGDAVRSLEPGVRISLDGNIADLEIYKDQFAVFEKIFGAHINLNPTSPCQQYNGSLFRFPLRNANCARTSAIKPVHYSDSEMRDLLSKVKESLQTLILFTQNVSSLSVYELKDHAKTPTDMKLLFSATKSKDHGIRDMVHLANNQIYPFIEENHVTSSIDLKVQKDKALSTQKWIVQSRNGGVDTYNFVKNHPNEGYLPYCSVAVCVNAENEIVQQNGHFFCFLPLPIKNGLPCHVNAAFELSSNRLSLKLHNEDEKIYHTVENWNDLIAQDVGNAYYSLLLHLINKMGISGQDFFNLFPSKDKLEIQHFTKIVLRSLINNCFKRNDAVFPFCKDSTNENTTSWMRWRDLCFPGPTIPEPIQASCISFLNWQNKKFKQQTRFVRLPTLFKALIRKLGFNYQITPKEISFQQVMQIMSQNVQDTELPQQIRYEIVNFLLAKATLHKTPLIKQPCIPTKPNGRLRRIDELVEENSLVSGLYDVEDERFPDLTNDDVIKYLKTRGMESAGLSWRKILERAENIQLKRKKQRGTSLLKLISQKVEHRDVPKSFNEEYSSCQQLRKVKFLPVLKEPKPSLFNIWHGASTKLCSPEEIYPNSFSTTLSSSNYICSEKMEDDVMNFLQINPIPRQEDLLLQLDSFLPNFDTTNQKCKSILKSITIAFTQIKLSKETQIILAHSKFILADNCKLYSSETVFLKADHKITDKLHSLHDFYNDIEQDVKQFFVDIGVKEEATGAHYTNALKSLSVEYKNNPLLKHHLQEIYHLVPTLVNFEEKESFIEDLYLPDQQAVLQKASKLCYNDVIWLPNVADVHYLNAEISFQHAQDLKIKSRRSDYVLRGKHTDDTAWIPQSQIEEFGQHESLTKRIKSLIKNYSDPFDVLKEMIQNADDAEGSEIEFILDKRHHGTEKVLSEKWDNLQGPGLLIINNGQFTKGDLEGIQQLGYGSRKDDALKTGKYGVGFNTVYSLTDCPILLTRVDGAEDRMCMFDPHLKYAEGSNDRKPGCAIKDAREFLEPYGDIKNAFLFDEKELETKTILRLPFRIEKMAAESEILNKSVSIQEVEKTLKQFLKHGDEFLLFLNNIKTIKIRIINGEGEKDDLFCVQSELYDTHQRQVDDFKLAASRYGNRLGDMYELMDSETQLRRKHCIRHYVDDQLQFSHHWDVFEQIGFSDLENIPDKVTDILESREYHLVPRGGIAKLAWKDNCIKCEKDKPKKNDYTTLKSLFCTLPLNLTTGIPGIMNGNFALESENRRALYNGDDARKEWNQTILNHCVLPCFISHLEYVKSQIEGKYDLHIEKDENDDGKKKNEKKRDIEKLQQDIISKMDRTIKKFQNLFPTTAKSTDEYFKKFTKSFYTNIADEKKRLLPVNRPGDVRFWSPAEFLLFEGEVSTANLLKVMKMANLKADVLQEEIIKNFTEIDRPLTRATSSVVRTILQNESKLIFRKDNADVDKSSLKCINNVKTLLEFCLKKENSSNQTALVLSTSNPQGISTAIPEIDLSGLPLCLLQSNNLTYFNPNSPSFLTRFTTLFEENNRLFIHKSIFDTLNDPERIDQSCFKDFTLVDFKEMMSDSKLKHLLTVKQFLINFKNEKEECILKNWLTNSWGFIYSQCRSWMTKNAEDNEVIKEQLEIVKDVSLLFVKKADKEYLIPVKYRNQIIFEDSKTPSKLYCFVTQVCQGFQLVPNTYKKRLYSSTFDYTIYPEGFCDIIFAKTDNFNDIVECLEFALSSEQTTVLPNEETRDFLDRLLVIHNDTSNVSQQSRDKLCSLPLFQNYESKMVKASGTVHVLPFDVPRSALVNIEQLKNITILNCIPALEKLYKNLGFKYLTAIDFYVDFVFPYLEKFDDDQVQEYLYVIISGKVRANNYLDIGHLQFVRTNTGTRKSCDELYDPRNDLFHMMEPDANFPKENLYPRLNEDQHLKKQWLDFFKKLGMVHNIKDGNHFLRYAQSLEAETNKEKNQKVSKILCDKLLINISSRKTDVVKWSRDEKFLDKLKEIRFIVPNECIFHIFASSSKNSLTENIAYNLSVTTDCNKLVGKSKYVLPEYATKRENKIMPEEVMRRLGIDDRRTLAIEPVRENLMQITTSEKHLEKTDSSTCREIKLSDKTTYEWILEDVYEFLSAQNRDGMDKLGNISFILVDEGRALDQPKRCFLSTSGSIAPYLNNVPKRLGKYFQMFHTLGCTENPTFTHYVDVLSQIQRNQENEEKKHLRKYETYKAVSNLSRLIAAQVTGSLKIERLFLPTVTFVEQDKVKLTLSSECLMVDDLSLEKRLEQFQQPILVSSYTIDRQQNKEINEKLVEHLPEKVKPKKLRSSVHEVLCSSSNETVRVEKAHISKVWQRKIRHPEFLNGLKRLINHENTSKQEKYLDDKILKSVQVIVLEEVQTELHYREEPIEGSQVEKSVFPLIVDESLKIYFSKTSSDSPGVATSVTNALLKLFGTPLNDPLTVSCFVNFLNLKPEDISEYLDDQSIIKIDNDPEYRRARTPLGQPIPQKHIGILILDSFEFEVDYYVAFDENDEGEDYVYAKIVSLNDDGTVKIQLVDDEDVDVDEAEGFKDVPKSTLYKFEKKYSKPQEEEIQDEQSQEVVTMETCGARRRSREEKSKEREETRSYEEICGEIKKTITDAKSKDEEEQKRVLRRLYLKWHPDKHPNKDLANEVFKFLMNEKKQLNSDFSDHFTKWDEQASNSRSSRQSYEEDFFNQQSGFRQSSSFYDNVPPKFTREDPQPAEARRWFRQAQYDLNQALEIKTCPEWICYVSHQVAEKALKAAIFSKDYKQTLLDERNLRSLVRNFQHADDELKKDVEELQSLIIDENKPRYPCRRSQKIPHDKYNQQNADRALILAQRIMENIVRNFEVE